MTEEEFLNTEIYHAADLVRTHYQYEAQWVVFHGYDPQKIEPFKSALEPEVETDAPDEDDDDTQDMINEYLKRKK